MRRRYLFAIVRLAVVVIAMLSGVVPAAASALVGTPLALCVARVAPGDGAAARLQSPAGFDCATRQTRFGAGDFWLRSGPIRVDGEVRVRTGSLWQRQATIHALYADGAIVSRRFDVHGATRALQLGAIIEQRFPPRAAPLVRLLWRVDGAANLRGIVVGARLATAEQSAEANLWLGALYAAFGGICLALLVYNLALWGALRHDFQLAYCAMLLMMLGYAFSSSGALAWAWPWIANNDRLRINHLMLALSAAGALSFARQFFEPHIFAGRLDRIARATALAIIASGVFFVVVADRHFVLADRLYQGAFALLGPLAAAILWQAWRRRSNFLWLFALAWGAPIVFAVARVGSSIGLIGWSFALDNSTLAAMTAEALLSSLAIAYRFRLLSRERDEAREKAIAARLLADTDALTGLLNRRAFLREAIGRPGAQQLIVADIDHFKAVNETLGHDGGDEVLRLIARALRTAAPPGTLIARIGGEEFALVSDAGRAIAPEHLLAIIRAQRMPFDLAVTASLGVCAGPLTGEADWKALYRRADQALFAAKAAGRDRARVANGDLLAA